MVSAGYPEPHEDQNGLNRTIDLGYEKVVDFTDEIMRFLKEDIQKLAYHTIHNSQEVMWSRDRHWQVAGVSRQNP